MDIVKGMYFLKELLKDDVYVIVENKRYPLLVLVEDTKSPFLEEKNEELLEKILQSVGIKVPETRLLNTAHLLPEDGFDSFQELPSKRVLSFGVDLKTLGLNLSLKKYELKTQDNITFLLADTLPEIATDKEMKKKLWQGLKQLFFEHFQ